MQPALPQSLIRIVQDLGVRLSAIVFHLRVDPDRRYVILGVYSKDLGQLVLLCVCLEASKIVFESFDFEMDRVIDDFRVCSEDCVLFSEKGFQVEYLAPTNGRRRGLGYICLWNIYLGPTRLSKEPKREPWAGHHPLDSGIDHVHSSWFQFEGFLEHVIIHLRKVRWQVESAGWEQLTRNLRRPSGLHRVAGASAGLVYALTRLCKKDDGTRYLRVVRTLCSVSGRNCAVPNRKNYSRWLGRLQSQVRRSVALATVIGVEGDGRSHCSGAERVQ